jgi:hypothetical protein
VDLGLEITIVEANPCRVDFDHPPGHTDIPSLAPGQKSYARAKTCGLLEATVGIGKRQEPILIHAGLQFPDVGSGQGPNVSRTFAYPPSAPSWVNLEPFQHTEDSMFTNVTVSLIPPYRTLKGVWSVPDGFVHVHATLPGRRDAGVFLRDVRLDPTTQQLIGYGPSMAIQDSASLWILSFFIAPGITG